MSILRVHTALAAALLALALVPNLSRADDTTAGTVICKDGTKVTGSTVQHTGRAECAGRGGIDYAATKALPENQANTNAPTASTDTSGTAMVRCMDGTSVAHTGPDSCAAHGGMDHSAHGGAMTHGTMTPGSEGNTAAAAGAAGAAGAATAGTAGESTPGSTEESNTASHDTHLAEAERTQAPGGGPGKVWVNTQSKKYHCPSDHAYGKTAQGEYMTEADAKAQGFKPSHGKACE